MVISPVATISLSDSPTYAFVVPLITAIAILPAIPTLEAPAPEIASVTNSLVGPRPLPFTSTFSHVNRPSNAEVVRTLPFTERSCDAFSCNVAAISCDISSLRIIRQDGFARNSASVACSNGVPARSVFTFTSARFPNVEEIWLIIVFAASSPIRSLSPIFSAASSINFLLCSLIKELISEAASLLSFSVSSSEAGIFAVTVSVSVMIFADSMKAKFS